jgi:AcrR family transcriptional regulator
MDLRRQILDTARGLLIEQGYAQFSLRKIASQIGCSATAIYLYFDNRDALVHALIDEGFEMLSSRIVQASQVEIVPDDPLARLRLICHEYIAFGLENPEYYEIMFMLNPQDLARFPTEKYRRASRNLEPFMNELTSGIGDGRFGPINTKHFANVVWASLHGGVAIVLAKRLDIRIDRAQFLNDLIENCLLGLARN